MLKKEQRIIREACVETLDDAVSAEKAGADRIELCSRLDLDGLTPGEELLLAVLQALTIPVFVMIRPRAGNFIYDRNEVAEMKRQIDMVKKSGAPGIVLGVLDQNNEVDKEITQELVHYASPLNVTFHKAIDLTPDPVDSVRVLRQIKGITGILSSGGAPTAAEGAGVLQKMVREAGHIDIVVAGKVTRFNIDELHNKINAPAYHGKKIVSD